MNRKRALRRSTFFIMAAIAGTAWGQDATYNLGEVVVTAPRYDYSPPGAATLDPATLDMLRPATSDAAGLLRDIPGVSLYGAGGVSSLPSVHGLADDRLRVKVDGVDLIAACPNHMNSPLSYIDPTAVAGAKVYAGIAPVSLGGDSIGGTILVESAKPQFAKPGEGKLVTGDIGAFYRSNGDAWGAQAKATMANDKLSVTYSGSTAQSGNYTAGDGFKSFTATGRPGQTLPVDEVGSSAYESTNQGLDIAGRNDNHLLDLKYDHQHIPYEGFPNQRMDMTDNRSDQLKLDYTGRFGWGVLEGRVYNQTVDHEMQFGDDKMFAYPNNAPGMPMNTRSNTTGTQLKANIALSDSDILRVGGEYQRYRLDDWWPASGTGGMSPYAFQNISNGQRDRYAVFGEWEKHFGDRWLSQLGVRHETVESDAGCVHGYNLATCPTSGTGGTGGQTTDAVAFNNAGRAKTDRNWDLTALARFTPDVRQSYEFGLAQKTRSPNLYERYSWSTWSMAAVMNNYVGDGNGYVGDLNLKPEVAYTASATADWHDADKAKWGVKLTPYYTYVDNYIDAKCAGATCTVNQFNVLKFVNQSAELYGLDLSGNYALGEAAGYGAFALNGALNYAKGTNKTTGDGLYNIMPLNTRLALVQKLGRWTNVLEAQFVAGKHDVSKVRNEIETGGYSLFNLRGSYQWKKARLDVGVENLFDRTYSLPLGGAYLGQGRTMSMTGLPWGIAVPGMGRSFYTSFNYTF